MEDTRHDEAAPPETDYPLWSDSHGPVEIRFVGRGPDDDPEVILGKVEPIDTPSLGWARQVHGDEVLDARPGPCGKGDGLVTHSSHLALAVVTADCVPVLLAGSRKVSAVHAGWRGLVAGILQGAVDRMDEPATDLKAWIGPAIGTCCYEIGEDVADKLEAVSSADHIHRHEGTRPHADLQGIARLQLERAGVGTVETVESCTSCEAELLWSYRRQGKAAGRNVAFVWRRDDG